MTDDQKPLDLGPLAISHRYIFEAFDKDGHLKWREVCDNLVVTEGRNDILDKYYTGSAYTAAHYIGLKGAGAIAAADTMASHAGWSEVTGYSQAARPTLAWSAASAGSKAASGATTFSINATVTAAGGFITTNATKGGTTGTLVGCTDFSVSRSLVSGDTLNVTPTASLTSA